MSLTCSGVHEIVTKQGSYDLYCYVVPLNLLTHFRKRKGRNPLSLVHYFWDVLSKETEYHWDYIRSFITHSEFLYCFNMQITVSCFVSVRWIEMGSDPSCCLSANDLLFFIFLSRCWNGKSKMCLPTVKVMLALNLLNCRTSKSILIFIWGDGQLWTVLQPLLSSRLALD